MADAVSPLWSVPDVSALLSAQLSPDILRAIDGDLTKFLVRQQTDELRRALTEIARPIRLFEDIDGELAKHWTTTVDLTGMAAWFRAYLPETPEKVAEVQAVATEIVASPEKAQAVEHIIAVARRVDFSALRAKAGPYAVVLALWVMLAKYAGPPEHDSQIAVIAVVLMVAQGLGVFPPPSK
jgi:hypothetical protein